MTQENMTFNHSLYHRETSSIALSQCQLIYEYFYDALENNADNLKKTHLFNGRYENIYLKNVTFEPLTNVLTDAKNQAAILLSTTINELSMDFWFNDMPPSHITDWHRHDVMDERLSGVFYIHVPNNSGDLLLKNKKEIVRIKPKDNDFVFFEPDVNHYVEENKSSTSRLSIGMNFGFLNDKEEGH